MHFFTPLIPYLQVEAQCKAQGAPRAFLYNVSRSSGVICKAIIFRSPPTGRLVFVFAMFFLFLVLRMTYRTFRHVIYTF